MATEYLVFHPLKRVECWLVHSRTAMMMTGFHGGRRLVAQFPGQCSCFCWISAGSISLEGTGFVREEPGAERGYSYYLSSAV